MGLRVEASEESLYRQEASVLTVTPSSPFCVPLGEPFDLSSHTKATNAAFLTLPRLRAVNRIPRSINVEVLFKLEHSK